jgi:hypothetical protein
MNEHLALVAAIFSAIATALAAVATWRAPITAARLAETLRRDADRSAERQRQKLWVFSTLMQERAQIYSDNGVRALNLVDVVFSGCREVRDAWAELYSSFHLKPLPPHVVSERLLKLLRAIAEDLGLADELRSDDLARVYRPLVQEQEQFIKDTQRQQALARLQGENAAGASDASAPSTVWPPKPE